MIDVRCDLAGLRIAAEELFEESFRAREVQALLDQIPAEFLERADVEEIVTKVMPARTVSQGYYAWLLYLVWLRQMVELPGTSLQLRTDEAEGVLIIRAAEQKFRAAHPPCWKCGEYNEKGSGCCRDCGAEFKD